MIPLWIKILYTIVVVIVIVFYAIHHGPANFLWFSDIALILIVPALWLENRWLISMMAVGVLLPEIVWNLSFFGRLLFGISTEGITCYMFDSEKPLYLRLLSLFHVILPVILLWSVFQLGYEPDAWIAQTIFAWVILPLTYVLTDPVKNINWVYGLLGVPQDRLPPMIYLVMLMIAIPLLIYFPTHLLILLMVSG